MAGLGGARARVRENEAPGGHQGRKSSQLSSAFRFSWTSRDALVATTGVSPKFFLQGVRPRSYLPITESPLDRIRCLRRALQAEKSRRELLAASTS